MAEYRVVIFAGDRRFSKRSSSHQTLAAIHSMLAACKAFLKHDVLPEAGSHDRAQPHYFNKTLYN
jgi:hypothetical protein